MASEDPTRRLQYPVIAERFEVPWWPLRLPRLPAGTKPFQFLIVFSAAFRGLDNSFVLKEIMKW